MKRISAADRTSSVAMRKTREVLQATTPASKTRIAAAPAASARHDRLRLQFISSRIARPNFRRMHYKPVGRERVTRLQLSGQN